MVKSPAMLAQQLKIRRMSQPVASLHPLRMLAAGRFLHRAVAGGAGSIPVYSLDMIVLANAQDRTPFTTAILEHIATSTGLHALAKAVHPHSAADLRLISTFGHRLHSPKKRGPNSPRDVQLTSFVVK